MNVSAPWKWVSLGALATVVMLGFAGQLSSCAPVDRTLNPDARRWWQTEEDFHREIVDYCVQAYVTLKSGSERRADSCVDSSIRNAVRRGYLSNAWLRAVEG